MTSQFISKTTFILLLTFSINFASGQNAFTAFISQKGNLSFRLTKSGLYLYTSQKGELTGYGAPANCTISFDYRGRVEKVGTFPVYYDLIGRINKIGTTSISYDFSARVDKIGTTGISYDYGGNVNNIGGQRVSYNYSGKVERIGSATISYNYSGNVDKINDKEGFVLFRLKISSDE